MIQASREILERAAGLLNKAGRYLIVQALKTRHCPDCGIAMRREGAMLTCPNCGLSMSDADEPTADFGDPNEEGS